jgi:DNA adenine methylase
MLGPIKTHGGKSDLAVKIAALFPPKATEHTNGYLHYVEPYFGGGSVLLANDPGGISEVANDANQALTNFWRVLQDSEQFGVFQRIVQGTPFSESVYLDAQAAADSPAPASVLAGGSEVQWAVSFFIAARQSLSGRQTGFTGITKQRTRGAKNAEAAAWLSAVDRLPLVHSRMQRVLILNRPAVSVIRQQDTKKTLFYVDAPYIHTTRTSTKDYKQFEMTDNDHEQLVSALVNIEGRAVVSMYRHPIYDALHEEHGWRRVEFNVPNSSAMGASKERRVECVWLNY